MVIVYVGLYLPMFTHKPLVQGKAVTGEGKAWGHSDKKLQPGRGA